MLGHSLFSGANSTRHFRRLSALALAALLGCHVNNLWSLELGSSSVVIEERTEETSQDALVSGLRTVLVRLTGTNRPEVFPHVVEMLGQPDRWLEHKGYRETASGLALDAHFDVELLLESLIAAGVPVLGQVRPEILIWLVMPQDDLLRDVDPETSDEDIPEVYTALLRASASRGIPVVLPSPSKNTGIPLLAADIRGQFDDQIRRASATYATPLIATLVAGGRWRAPHWRLLDDERLLASGDLAQDAGMPDVVAEFVHRLADYLGEEYTVVARGNNSRLQVRVLDLSGLRAFVHTREQLRRIAGISEMEVRQLDEEAATFDVDFIDTPARLVSLLRLDPFLGNCPLLQPEMPLPVDEIVLCWRGFP